MPIRPFTSDDAPFVAALAKETLPEPWSEQALRTLPSFARFFVSYDQDGRISGFCGLYLIADEGQIMEVAVAPDHRRRGIARDLLSHMIQDARAAGAVRFSLEVRSQNQGAQALYASLGFTVTATRRRYYKNPDDDAVLMDLV